MPPARLNLQVATNTDTGSDLEDDDQLDEVDEEPLSARELEEQKGLFDEIDSESLREVTAILTRYPRLIDREFDEDGNGLGQSPLLRAVNTENIKLVALLLELGANVTPQILQYQREIMEEDTEGEGAAIFRLLEGTEEEEDEEEEDPLTIGELVARRKFHTAIETRDNVTAKAVLAQHPKLANIPYDHETPLTNAVSSRNLEFVKHLIANGARVDGDDLEHAQSLAGDLTIRMSPEERNIAQDIYDVIEAHFLEPAVAPRALDFGAEPAVVAHKLENVEVKYTDMPTAYDMLEMEEIPILDLLTTGEKMVFKVGGKYFSTDWVPLRAALGDKSSTFYECKAELDGAPYAKDVYMEMPYFRLSLMGNFTIPERDLLAAFDSSRIVFELIPSEKKLAFVSSYASVQITPGVDGLGRQVNIVSSDHCQKGSQQVTYTLKAVTMSKKNTGGSKKRSTYRKRKTNKRKTIRRRK